MRAPPAFVETSICACVECRILLLTTLVPFETLLTKDWEHVWHVTINAPAPKPQGSRPLSGTYFCSYYHLILLLFLIPPTHKSGLALSQGPRARCTGRACGGQNTPAGSPPSRHRSRIHRQPPLQQGPGFWAPNIGRRGCYQNR